MAFERCRGDAAAFHYDHGVRARVGLPEAAAKEGLSPLAYMKKYGCFEVLRTNYVPYEAKVESPPGAREEGDGIVLDEQGHRLGVAIDGVVRNGFATPSGKLELWSETLHDWGWPELEHVGPWPLESHVSPKNVDRSKGEMILLPNFRLPTLIHTRSANAKWLYEISHTNPLWMNPLDAARLGLDTGSLARVATEIGWFVDRVWVTEGIKPGIVAMSHHLGRWRLQADQGGNRATTSLAELEHDGKGGHALRMVGGAQAWESEDPDTARVWWNDVGVHQNLTHAVHPDPVSGGHCWLQKVTVRPAEPGERHGDVFVDTKKSRAVYLDWLALTRSAVDVSPNGERRPYWLRRPLKPVRASYALPEHPFGR